VTKGDVRQEGAEEGNSAPDKHWDTRDDQACNQASPEEALNRDASALDRRRAALALADAARARVRAERQGAPLPDSADVIERLRTGTDDDAGLR